MTLNTVSRVGKMPLAIFVSASDYVGILPAILVHFIAWCFTGRKGCWLL
ncbi:hypothetical protein QUF75_14270 [Desulfococcaceae bacterium HSG7]|nr:hypothetical protein [Desulfococcaceae bacterium HSG7]